jgi:adenylyltransferase/sulfurtransferase
LVPSCAEGGVLGVLPGILGSLQASEVIKVLTGVGETLSGRLFLFDAASFETRTLRVRANPDNPLTGVNPTQKGLIDYEQFCGLGITERHANTIVKEIDVETLATWRDSGKAHQLIDVREPYEYAIAEIGGDLFPLGHIEDYASRIRRDVKVVVQCRSGVRSAKAIQQLEARFGFDNLYNLKGGILAWADRIDQSVAKY